MWMYELYVGYQTLHGFVDGLNVQFWKCEFRLPRIVL